MLKKMPAWMTAGTVALSAATAAADTEPYFVPLTASAPVTMPNSDEELNAPWVVPAGVTQTNLTSMSEIESDSNQSVVRASGAGTSASMWDMAAFDATGRFVFNPHESPWSAGLSRYDRVKDENTLLWQGDGNGASGNWSNDYGAFDPATFTPNCTVLVAEEWTGEGRVIETLNPFASPDQVQIRELDSIANTSHEGLLFSRDERTLYYVDEWNSGSIYKFVMTKKGDYTKGQTFVLSVDAFAGDPAANYNEGVNGAATRTGLATWVPITDESGIPLTATDPFRNGPTDDPRTNPATRGGRGAADEVNGTPYGRPEDMEISTLRNGKEVMYFAATSETSVYSVEMLPGNKAMVRLFLSGAATPKNLGFAPTTGALNSPDNLAQDALGNIFIIEDAPNGSSTGGDIWFARDVDDDGVAESIDHFMSIRADGSEATGMIFNPLRPTQFVVNVQHPDSTDLDSVPNGFGDALWQFDLAQADAPCAEGQRCRRHNAMIPALRLAGVAERIKAIPQTLRCRAAIWQQMNEWVDAE